MLRIEVFVKCEHYSKETGICMQEFTIVYPYYPSLNLLKSNIKAKDWSYDNFTLRCPKHKNYNPFK